MKLHAYKMVWKQSTPAYSVYFNVVLTKNGLITSCYFAERHKMKLNVMSFKTQPEHLKIVSM